MRPKVLYLLIAVGTIVLLGGGIWYLRHRSNQGLQDPSSLPALSVPSTGSTSSQVMRDRVQEEEERVKTLPLDTDGDGLSDEEEKKRGTDRQKTDTDGDGRGDGLEYVAGTDPLVTDYPAAGRPRLDIQGSVSSTSRAPALSSVSSTQPAERALDTDHAGLSDEEELRRSTNEKNRIRMRRFTMRRGEPL